MYRRNLDAAKKVENGERDGRVKEEKVMTSIKPKTASIPQRKKKHNKAGGKVRR